MDTILIRDNLSRYFNESELKDLCFDLNVQYENLPGNTKNDRARELVAYSERHGKLTQLISRCMSLRPHVIWPELPPRIRISYSASLTSKVSKKGLPYFGIHVWLEADNSDTLDKVSKVIYQLHSTFKDPVREVVTRENNFELKTIAWGQFTIRAAVLFRDDETVTLSRYISFNTKYDE